MQPECPSLKLIIGPENLPCNGGCPQSNCSYQLVPQSQALKMVQTSATRMSLMQRVRQQSETTTREVVARNSITVVSKLIGEEGPMIVIQEYSTRPVDVFPLPHPKPVFNHVKHDPRLRMTDSRSESFQRRAAASRMFSSSHRREQNLFVAVSTRSRNCNNRLSASARATSVRPSLITPMLLWSKLDLEHNCNSK